MHGRLFLVGTPIGNLGDMTERGRETLATAARIYAEDTRRTKSLLSHFGIEGKKLLSLHAHSPTRTVATAIEILSAGEDIALVTDAGMPSVSDPGSALVRAAHEAGILVSVVPGPSAVTSAVASSGLVDGPFTFIGFLPRKGSKRTEALKELAQSRIPVVLFESPHRVHQTLADLREVCGSERQVAIARELTKRYEETRLTSLGEAAGPEYQLESLGEFTLVIGSNPAPAAEADAPLDIDERAKELLDRGGSAKDVSTQLSRELAQRGIKTKRRDLYSRIQLLLDARDARP